MPNLAVVLILAGVLLFYCEFIWVGKLLPGVAGSLSIFAGLAVLSRFPHTPLGIVFIALSGGCFLVELFLDTRWIAALAGSALLAFGFWRLIDSGQTVSAWLAFPLSGLFGLVTTALLALARQARNSKRKI